MTALLHLLSMCALLAAACACPPGSYRRPDSSCEPCPPDTFMPNANATTCWTCPRNSVPSRDATSCVCYLGTTWNNSSRECQPCAPGTFFYSTLDGTRSCMPCRANTYQPDAGQPHCLACPPSTYSAPASLSCTECAHDADDARSSACGSCPAGSEYDAYDGSCIPCKLDFFKSRAGYEPCIPCAPHAYSDVGSAECIQCSEHTAPMKDGSCGSCPAGYSYNAFERGCEKCRFGTFTSYANSMELCFVCAGHSYSFAGSSSCVKCPANQALMKDGSCAACERGFYYDERQFSCLPCPVNHVSAGGDRTICQTCPRGSYSEAGSSECLYCAPNTGYMASVRRCETCAPGEFYDQFGARCVRCHARSVKPNEGVEFCQTCAAGFTSNANHTACIPF